MLVSFKLHMQLHSKNQTEPALSGRALEIALIIAIDNLFNLLFLPTVPNHQMLIMLPMCQFMGLIAIWIQAPAESNNLQTSLPCWMLAIMLIS